MRFAVGATVLAAAFVRAEEEAEPSSSTTALAKPTFTVSTQSWTGEHTVSREVSLLRKSCE